MTDREKWALRTDPNEFFLESGSAWMKLSADAARDVCGMATSRNHFVSRVEGGVRHNENYEMRLDCIWDSTLTLPASNVEALVNDMEAREFILTESISHDVFVLTVSSQSGFRKSLN